MQLDPLRVTGNAALDDVETELEHGPDQRLGPGAREGREDRARERQRLVGDQTIAHHARATTCPPARSPRLRHREQSARRAARARSPAAARWPASLTSSGQLTAKSPASATLNGSGRIDIRPGRIEGFSLTKQVIGSLAALPALALAAKGKDLSNYDDEGFSVPHGDLHDRRRPRLDREPRARLPERDGVPARLGRHESTARSIWRARSCSPRRRTRELAGAERAKERTIPIAHIGGTLDAPRVELDQKTLAALASRLHRQRQGAGEDRQDARPGRGRGGRGRARRPARRRREEEIGAMSFFTVRLLADAVELLDQRRLPAEERLPAARDGESVARAIEDMAVRGAPAIGVTAAMGDRARARPRAGRASCWRARARSARGSRARGPPR